MPAVRAGDPIPVLVPLGARLVPRWGRAAAAPITRTVAWSIELRLWVAFCVTTSCAFASGALGLEVTSAVLVCVAASTLAIYNLDGTLDLLHDQPDTRPLRFYAHAVLSGCALLVALTSSLFLNRSARTLVWMGLFLCGCYALHLPRLLRPREPAYRAGGARRSLRTRVTAIKAIPGIKAPFVGSAVAVAVVWLPALAAGSRPNTIAAVVFCFSLACFCTANALLFDIPDVLEDTEHDVPTLPRLVGVVATRRSVALLCLSGIMTMAMFGNFFEAASVWGVFALGGVLLLSIPFIDSRTHRDSVALWIDGALILPWAVQSLAT